MSELADTSRHLTLLAEPIRVRLLALLEPEELAVGELTRILDAPQSTVSRHLKALLTAGWVQRRAEGTAGWFRMARLNEPADALWRVVREAFSRTPEHQADAERLAGVLAVREVDSETFFGQQHAHWDALRRELFGDDFTHRALLAMLPQDWVVADLGCGTGVAVSALAPAVARVIGVDREPAMLDAVRGRTRQFSNVDLRTGGLEDLPLSDGEADAAVCMLVLHHVADLGRAFSEIRRALRLGGQVVILDMVLHERAQYRRTMGHQHLGFDRETIETLSRQAGLQVRSWDILPPQEGVLGPELFVSVLG